MLLEKLAAFAAFRFPCLNLAGGRVARFFMVHDTKTGKMHQMNTKCTKWSYNFQNVCKIFQMIIKYINIFLAKALHNLPKLVFLV
jgi:hypothetical protein